MEDLRRNRIRYIWQKIHLEIVVKDRFLYIAGDYHHGSELYLWLSASSNTLGSFADVCHRSGICCKISANSISSHFCLVQHVAVHKGGKSTAVLQEIPCDTPAEMISEIWKWVHDAAGENSSPHQLPKKRGSWILKNLRPITAVNETADVQRFKLYRSQSVDSTLLKK